MVKRGMAGGHAPPATGWEGEVRKVLKEDWQVCMCGRTLSPPSCVDVLVVGWDGGLLDRIESNRIGAMEEGARWSISLVDQLACVSRPIARLIGRMVCVCALPLPFILHLNSHPSLF